MILYAVVEQYDNGGDSWDDLVQELTVRGLFTDGNAAEQHLEDGVNPEEWKLVEQKDGYRSYQDRERRYKTLVRYVSKVTTDTMHEDGCGLFPWLQQNCNRKSVEIISKHSFSFVRLNVFKQVCNLTRKVFLFKYVFLYLSY